MSTNTLKRLCHEANCDPTPDPWQYNSQFFSRWGTSATSPNPTPALDRALRLVSARYDHGGKEGGEYVQWWTVECNAWELQRVNADGGPFPPAAPADILANNQRRSKLQARITYGVTGLGVSFDLDISGGFRVPIHAPFVELSILLPQEGVAIRTFPAPAPLFGTGELLDTIVNCNIYDGLAPGVQKQHTLTFTRSVGAGSTLVEPIPPRAVAVEIYVPGATFLNGGLWMENPNAASLIGNIPFTFQAAVTGWTNIAGKPANANHLLLSNTDNATRFFTVIWHLEM